MGLHHFCKDGLHLIFYEMNQNEMNQHDILSLKF